MHIGGANRALENAPSEPEPTAHQLFGLLRAGAQRGIKRALRVTRPLNGPNEARGGGGAHG